MVLVAILSILMTMALAMIRAVLGPTVYDRMLAANHFGSSTVLLIAVGGYALQWHSFVDVALLYAMVNFVITIAIMRYIEASRTPSQPLPKEEA